MHGLVGGFLALWGLFWIAEIALAIWALVDVARSSMDAVMKVVWVAVILLFPILGSIAELIVNRTTTTATTA